jgi:hypothetical protein
MRNAELADGHQIIPVDVVRPADVAVRVATSCSELRRLGSHAKATSAFAYVAASPGGLLKQSTAVGAPPPHAPMARYAGGTAITAVAVRAATPRRYLRLTAFEPL